jgi:hypothetical protein
MNNNFKNKFFPLYKYEVTMFKNFFFFVIFCLLLVASSLKAQEMEKEALSLAIEQNMEVREFTDFCIKQTPGLFSTGRDEVKTSMILIPINKEIVDAALDYKFVIEKLTEKEINQLQQKTYQTYLTGSYSVFVLFVKNSETLDNDDEVYFNDFKTNVYLHDEQNKFSLKKYTRIFDAKLSPGWNKGYLYFQNFRSDSNFSYSIHFSGLVINACQDRRDHKPKSQTWAMSFDESDMRFFSMLQQGLSKDQIRKQYGITSYTTAGLTGLDILNIIGSIVDFISLFVI